MKNFSTFQGLLGHFSRSGGLNWIYLGSSRHYGPVWNPGSAFGLCPADSAGPDCFLEDHQSLASEGFKAPLGQPRGISFLLGSAGAALFWPVFPHRPETVVAP